MRKRLGKGLATSIYFAPQELCNTIDRHNIARQSRLVGLDLLQSRVEDSGSFEFSDAVDAHVAM